MIWKTATTYGTIAGWDLDEDEFRDPPAASIESAGEPKPPDTAHEWEPYCGGTIGKGAYFRRWTGWRVRL